MNKIICDICGTSYPDTAEECPICGCSREMSAEVLTQDVEEEVQESPVKSRAGLFGASRRSRAVEEKEEFDDEDYDEDEDEDEDYDDDDYDEDEGDDDEEEHKSNAPLVILLVIVILALLAVTSFIFVKYFLPNMRPAETTVPTTAATTLPEETTEATIPCENLALTSGGEVVLDGEGANWLINVMALPENTTDKLVYTSSDESVVTVDEQGKVTAVGEGSAVITITCGNQELTCTVTCAFAPETTAAPETEPEETTVPSEPEETTETTEPMKDITLKVSLTDITFNAKNQGYTFKVDGLKNTEVKWTSMDENIVTVDENGFVTSIGPGNTKIICQYGDQKVEIIIRCVW